jgi:peptidoglycan/LPS O-acetylase OafA/YrhL
LQVAAASLVSRLSLGTSIYYSSWFLGLFFLALIFICFCSYHFFEAPLQKAIRRMMAPHGWFASSSSTPSSL